MPTRPLLIMTRPEAQARRFVADCTARLGWQPAVIYAPVMEIAAYTPEMGAERFAGVILTSENGARMAPDFTGKRLYCVGKRTADAALDRGGDVRLVAANADDLVNTLIAENPPAPLLHCRGAHARGEIADRLNSAGKETFEMVVYDQKAIPLPAHVVAALGGEVPAVLPLFSPRSAQLTGRAVERLGAGLHVIAISAAVAEAWHAETGGEAEICALPDGKEMLRRCVAALRAQGA